MIFQHLVHRHGSDKKLPKGNWYNVSFTTLGTRGAYTPASFTEGLKVTKEGRVVNPDAILACHKIHDDIVTVRHLRSKMFYSAKFSPAD